MSVRILIGAAMLAAAALVAAPALSQEPTLREIYQAAESGNLAQAERMMSEVLRAHPNSSKAHYVEAELLAKQGQLSAAAAELNTAERLNPGLPFAKPEAVRELKARVASSGGFGMSTIFGSFAPVGGGGIPWGALLLGAAVLALIALAVGAVKSRRKAVAASTGSTLPYTPSAPMQPAGARMPAAWSPAGGMASNAPMPRPTTGAPVTGSPAGGGMGSAILGGLATGAAVGAGVVAGEALANRFIGGHHADERPTPPGMDVSQSDLGGNDFGVADNSSWDDGLGGVGGDGGGDWS